MGKLHVAVLTKATSPGRFDIVNRTWGVWTTPVPEFTWELMPVYKHDNIDAGILKNAGFDLAFLEDGAWVNYTGDGIPLVYYVVDSTVTESHYLERYSQAEVAADLVLLDHDQTERFRVGAPVRQLPHCVNTQIFKDYGPKTVDVAIHLNVGGSCGNQRKVVKQTLPGYCQAREFTYSIGPLGVEHYAAAMGQARVTINWPRFPGNRSHRVLDGMACNTCIITGPIPDVEGELRQAGRDYIQVDTPAQMLDAVRAQLENDRWKWVANNGYQLIKDSHTWQIRAAQLRQILKEELGL
jgi:hypothetical protein